MDKPMIHLIIFELPFQSLYPCILLHLPRGADNEYIESSYCTLFVYCPVNLNLGIMDRVHESYEA